MLSNLTWAHFLLIGGGGLVLWAIYVIFFSRNPHEGNKHPSADKKIWSHNQMPGSKSNNPVMDDEDEDLEYSHNEMEDQEDKDAEEENTYRALEELATEVSLQISKSGLGTSKEELFPRLQELIAGYPTLRNEYFKVAITNLVIRSAKRECLLELTSEEVAELWPS